MCKTLMPDETLISEARFHGFYTFSACAVFATCILAGWGAQQAIFRYLGQWSMMPLYVGSGVGLWMLFWMMVHKWTTEIILTDKRLIHKRGFFRINIDEVDIDQLASDYVSQSLLGRMLDYGALHIRCIEASDIWLPDIADPYAFRNAIEKMKHQYRERYMDVGRLRRHTGGNDGHHS